jgi:hypothetical protein
MNGHQKIIEMRMAGQKPEIVFLNDYPCETNWFETGDYANVEISPEDQPEWLDLRFLVRLRVSVTGRTEDRAKRLFDVCKKAGAKTVAACHLAQERGAIYGTMKFTAGWTEVYHG